MRSESLASKSKIFRSAHTRHNGKNQPRRQRASLLLPIGGICPQCGGASSRPPDLDPTNPLNQHPRGFAQVHGLLAQLHRLILEITLIILLVLGCCTLMLPEMRSFLEEWQKLQTGLNAHASLVPQKNNEAVPPSAPSPSLAVETPAIAYNEATSNGFERKESKKPSLKRRSRKRAVSCESNS